MTEHRDSVQRVGYALARAAVETERKGLITRISGLAVPYDTPTDIGWFTETIRPGCFARSIAAAAHGLPLLAFHNSTSLDGIIGRSHRFIERIDGLHGEWTVDDSDTAQRAASAASAGSLAYLSIGFVPIESRESFDRDDRLHIERIEARLLEVSMTPTPAYPTAAITDVRAVDTSRPRLAAARAWHDLTTTGHTTTERTQHAPARRNRRRRL